MRTVICLLADAEEVSTAVAELVAAQAEQSIQSAGQFSIVLSGGQTPRRMYEMLARPPLLTRIDWSGVHVFWGDERCVSPYDSRSNYRMAFDVWLRSVPIPTAQIHRIRGELNPREAAIEYQTLLKDYFCDRPPRFDLVLLGLGDDGHTASLFPHSPAIQDGLRWVAEAMSGDESRVTFTPSIINLAAIVAFVVTGSAKAGILYKVLHGPRDVLRLPAQAIEPLSGDLRWFVDRMAATKIAARERLDGAL
jgi:6-phosphogluconolactonase